MNNPAAYSPRATTQAPVRVARSIITFGFFCETKCKASARIILPSASVLSTSMLFPDEVTTISPGLIALPETIFSAEGMTPNKLTGSFALAAASTVPATTAAPDISAFISPILLAGLIEIPPASNVTPFPTNEKVLDFLEPLYSRIMNRGGLALPIPTAINPPIFLFLISFSLKTLTLTFVPLNLF